MVSISTLHVQIRHVLTYNNAKLKCVCLNVFIIANSALRINELLVMIGHCFNCFSKGDSNTPNSRGISLWTVRGASLCRDGIVVWCSSGINTKLLAINYAPSQIPAKYAYEGIHMHTGHVSSNATIAIDKLLCQSLYKSSYCTQQVLLISAGSLEFYGDDRRFLIYWTTVRFYKAL